MKTQCNIITWSWWWWWWQIPINPYKSWGFWILIEAQLCRSSELRWKRFSSSLASAGEPGDWAKWMEHGWEWTINKCWNMLEPSKSLVNKSSSHPKSQTCRFSPSDIFGLNLVAPPTITVQRPAKGTRVETYSEIIHLCKIPGTCMQYRNMP